MESVNITDTGDDMAQAFGSDPNVNYEGLGVMHPNDPLVKEITGEPPFEVPLGGRVDSSQENQANTPKPKELTRIELGKLRRMYVTIVHERIAQCGHTFKRFEQPRTNCEWCWFTFFQEHGEITKTADEIFRGNGKAALIQLQGEKFAKKFVRFMATIARMKEVMEQNGTGSTATETAGELGEVQETPSGRETA